MGSNIITLIFSVAAAALGTGITYLLMRSRITHIEVLSEQKLQTLERQEGQSRTQMEEMTLKKQALQETLSDTTQKLSSLSALFNEIKQQKEQAIERINEQEDVIKRMIRENTVMQESMQHLQEHLEEEKRAAQEKQELLERSKEQLKLEFQNLANRIFEEKSTKFSTQNQENLNLLLKPFKEQMSEFKKKVEDTYTTEAKERHTLAKEISQLKELNLKMSQDAINLTNALKGESKTQGNWGEMVLERILEESGLRKGIEYEVQASFKDEEGATLRPDVIIRLPEEKDIVVDSKLSLNAYEAYNSAETQEEQQRHLLAHLQSIRNHIRDLSGKKYDHLEGLRSLDFVLMFMPIESAFLLAAREDSQLFAHAFERHIVIVSPSTLLVTLRTIQNIWRYEYQNQNAQEIARQAGNLYDKFTGFVEDMDKIGTQLQRTQVSYDEAYKKLSTGKGNLINRANTMLELGVKSKKRLEEQS